jgi:hypothetical protein
MNTLRSFTVQRLGDAWQYEVRLATSSGETLQFQASVEDLDAISVAIDEHMLEMVAEAERRGQKS